MHRTTRMTVLVTMMVTAACSPQGKAGVDTTKLIYRDDEAPKEQIYVVNGVETAIPWAKVPESQRWIKVYQDGGKSYEVRVPIVRIEVSSRDREGRPVPEKQGYEVSHTLIGLNPTRTMHVYYGHAH